jgi:hypothetical protein
MIRLRLPLFLLLCGLSTAQLTADDAPKFKFEKGQVLTYRIVQKTSVAETIQDETTKKLVDQKHVTQHTVERRWKVIDVDEKGVGTLEMSITAMKWELTTPEGKTETFDSAKPSDDQPEMAKLLNTTLAVLRIDPQGKLVEVKETKVGSKNRFEADPPFKILLPPAIPKKGDTWERPFAIKLDPPQGAGERYEATQKYEAVDPTNGFLTVKVTTALKDAPKEPSDQIPLLPNLVEGTVFFHAGSGRYVGARLQWRKEINGHQGDGTKYSYESLYSEDLNVAK